MQTSTYRRMKDFSLNQAGKILDKAYLCNPYGFHINIKEKTIKYFEFTGSFLK